MTGIWIGLAYLSGSSPFGLMQSLNGTAALTGHEQATAPTAQRPASLQSDPAREYGTHDALIFDVAGHLATRQAGQLEPLDANPRR